MNNKNSTDSGSAREALANRTAYGILALLLITVLTVTVVAIVATVNKRNDKLPVDGEMIDGQPSDGDDSDNNGTPSDNGGTEQQPDSKPPAADGDDGAESGSTPSDTAVFVAPCNGNVMKPHSDKVLSASTTMNDYRTHSGVDISGNVGDPVYAFSEGVITEIRSTPLMGQMIVISHANGISSKYMNLSTELPEGIAVGAEVEAGALIGAIGETAIIECAEPSHLHFELYVNDQSVDPTAYVTLNSDIAASDKYED